MLDSYFEDLTVGQRYVTRGRTVTEADVVTFSGFSGDYHALHTDAVWASEGPFGARVAHGLCTLSISSGLVAPFYTGGQNASLAFYGMDRVRFINPVFLGDTVHVELEIIRLDSKDGTRGIVTTRHEIKNQYGETVIVLEQRSLVKKRAYDETTATTPGHDVSSASRRHDAAPDPG